MNDVDINQRFLHLCSTTSYTYHVQISSMYHFWFYSLQSLWIWKSLKLCDEQLISPSNLVRIKFKCNQFVLNDNQRLIEHLQWLKSLWRLPILVREIL